MARVLQTLDDDGDPTNGITISADVRSKAANATAKNISAITTLDDIASEITSLTTRSGASLVTAADAEAHLDETLASISGADVTSCSHEDATPLSNSDFDGLVLGKISDNETLLFKFHSGGTFTEYNNGDNPEYGALTWDGDWLYNETAETLTLTFTPGDTSTEEIDSFKICAAGSSRVITELEDGADFLFRLNTEIKDARADGAYLLKFSGVSSNPDDLLNDIGAVLSLNDSKLTYFQGDDILENVPVTYGTGKATINWADSGEPADELYFISGQPTRTAIYIDYGEDDSFSRIGVATATAPITKLIAEEADLAGKALLFRSDKYDEVVVFELKGDGTYTSYFNDSYNQFDEREAAERREHSWSIADGILHLDEEGGTEERWRTALSTTTTYWALQDDENKDEINKIDSVSLSARLTDTSFIGTYDIGIPTENNAKEVLTILEGDSCDYSGTGCNWSIDENGKGIITFGSGSDAQGNIWQMANRSNGYIFVMTHENNPSDVEPGFMTRQ